MFCLHFSLGMYHDGKMNGCSKDDYIMGPKVVQFHRLKNVSTGFTFSPCSCKQAKAVVEGTNTKGHKLVSYAGKECMLQDSYSPCKTQY